MHRLWKPVIEPLLDAAQPSVIVEVGADQGATTERLLAWCRDHDARLHVIDPSPSLDPDRWRVTNGDVGIFHLERSLNALAHVGDVDIVLIDGDHNYFTVLRELRLLAKHQPAGSGFPLVLLHDIHWPYGRRDLYYDPDAIPPAHRQPHRRLGLRPDRAEPCVEGGFNAHLHNGLYENDLDNGVLTAVEDFLAETDARVDLHELPGLHGLGVLADPATHPPGSEVPRTLDELAPRGRQRAHLEAVEQDRLHHLVRAHEERSSHQTAARDLRAARADLDDTRRDSTRLSRELEDAHRATNDLRTDLAHAQQELDEQLTHAQQEAERAQQEAERAQQEAERSQQELTATSRHLDAEARATREWRRRAKWLEGELARIRQRKVVRAGLRTVNTLGALLGTGQQATTPAPAPPRTRGGPASDRALSGSAPPRQKIPAAPGPTMPAHANIVIPVHDAPEDVRRCLDAVAAHTNLRAHPVILVDDGSRPETASLLREAAVDLGARLIRRETAGGFGVAATAGIDAAWLPAVALLNSDTIVGPGWLDRLLACAQSDPSIGIVGPWSNAATWQSVPHVVGPDGTWTTNPQLDPRQVPEINQRLALGSARLRPRVPLVNGFCYLVTRELLDAVGGLDTDTFPRGYGEEDDLSIRASGAGFTAAIADDCFVYHAKSASYTPAERDAITAMSKRRLIEKHGEAAVTDRAAQMRIGRDLVRARAHAAGLVECHDAAPSIPRPGPSVAWVQPHLRQVGGIRRALEMSNRLAAAGWDITLVSLDAENDPAWLPRRAPAVSLDEARSRSFDVLLVSDPDVVPAIDTLDAQAAIVYHLDAYHLYREHGVEDYYALARTAPNLANSRWTAAQVGEAANVSIEQVIPGAVDLRQFAPRPAPIDHDVVCYGSRRPRKRTPLAEEAATGLRLGKLVELSGSQGDLSWQYSRARVFVSASSQEGFNLPCLEAMACGVPVVCTDDGGSSEYVVDGDNALVSPSDDPTDLRARIDAVLDDEALASRLIESGLRTAGAMGWDRPTAALGEFLRRAAA